MGSILYFVCTLYYAIVEYYIDVQYTIYWYEGHVVGVDITLVSRLHHHVVVNYVCISHFLTGQ